MPDTSQESTLSVPDLESLPGSIHTQYIFTIFNALASTERKTFEGH